MNWLNTFLPQLRDDRFSGASTEELGVWLRLVAYCAAMENGGSIVGCGSWTEQQWPVAIGISKEAVQFQRERGLWEWNPPHTSIWVYGYPTEQETRMKAMRVGGKRGARKRWKPKNVLPIQQKSAGDL
ncbi:MAG TPA: hypothetical protein VNH18_26445 [Bryobacteraceae bacterium]|nr:hypothetical protein [Bryobacteraceae bacterium]